MLKHTTGDKERDRMVEILIKKLQTPVRENEHYDLENLQQAIQIGKKLEMTIYLAHKMVDRVRKDKLRSMISVLTQYPHMRKKRLLEQITCEEICKMKRDDFLTTELKR